MYIKVPASSHLKFESKKPQENVLTFQFLSKNNVCCFCKNQTTYLDIAIIILLCFRACLCRNLAHINNRKETNFSTKINLSRFSLLSCALQIRLEPYLFYSNLIVGHKVDEYHESNFEKESLLEKFSMRSSRYIKHIKIRIKTVIKIKDITYKFFKVLKP